MQKSIRQSMAWLHSWVGLLLGWLLFSIFLFGTLSYYKNQITHWMQPQWQNSEISQQKATVSAWNYLQKNASDAQNWYIYPARPEQPFNQIYWQKADNSYESKSLDYKTGLDVKNITEGGDFFYNFHFQLYAIPIVLGRIITSIAAFLMLIALISGIITHKKIFTDFFTLRTFKSQRSWLDFHNVVSVIALPFFLTITFTGLAIFFYIYLPYGLQKNYPDNSRQFFQEIAEKPIKTAQPPLAAAPMISLAQLQHIVQQQWPDNPEIENIRVKKPNTTQAEITIKQTKDESITINSPQLSLMGSNGTLLENTRRETPISSLYAGVYGLHMALFAQPLLRFALFFSGLLGCFMIASGMLLWSLKRQLQNKQSKFHFGHYLVDRLNISTCVGLPIATLVYFYANRLWTISQPTNYEVACFFSAWLISLVLALLTPKEKLWQSQLIIFIVLASCLPFLNMFVLYKQGWVQSVQDYLHYVPFDAFLWAFSALAIFIYLKIKPIQQQARQKIVQKIQQKQRQT
ncbi:PepSY-associated TM helix domain-containing protein [Acinetobacter sp. MD2(2019)]|uniref:PepSY-associated TM helix domain-containing protein n=1 Tax=Acinetobacter sp. MD2(2019) TaxID=2605273 RepID=UPI002D1EF8D4|nr:PepSY-associated TM helix domain-containing protein [Acinetobacter sp. MD2(2019)]MEB3752958.1 PepSY domain-containing protein [Acinetobacter sp. MD2(2019)]